MIIIEKYILVVQVLRGKYFNIIRLYLGFENEVRKCAINYNKQHARCKNNQQMPNSFNDIDLQTFRIIINAYSKPLTP